jgi:hypothetical protein
MYKTLYRFLLSFEREKKKEGVPFAYQAPAIELGEAGLGCGEGVKYGNWLC